MAGMFWVIRVVIQSTGAKKRIRNGGKEEVDVYSGFIVGATCRVLAEAGRWCRWVFDGISRLSSKLALPCTSQMFPMCPPP